MSAIGSSLAGLVFSGSELWTSQQGDLAPPSSIQDSTLTFQTDQDSNSITEPHSNHPRSMSDCSRTNSNTSILSSSDQQDIGSVLIQSLHPHLDSASPSAKPSSLPSQINSITTDSSLNSDFPGAGGCSGRAPRSSVYCHLMEQCVLAAQRLRVIVCPRHATLGPYFIASRDGHVTQGHVAPDSVCRFLLGCFFFYLILKNLKIIVYV